jgi:hypothetical protein
MLEMPYVVHGFLVYSRRGRQELAGSKVQESRSVEEDVKSNPKSIIRRLCTVLGATVIGTLVVLAVLEIVSHAAWSFAYWLNPPSWYLYETSPAYAGANWEQDLFREQTEIASPYTYVPFLIMGMNPWHGSISTTMNTQPASGAGQ